MEQQQNWLDEEAKQFTSQATYEELPSLKLQPNVIAELTIDFSKPFQEWKGEQSGKTITKKIIPVQLAGTKMNWWVNVKNPIYRRTYYCWKSRDNSVQDITDRNSSQYKICNSKVI